MKFIKEEIIDGDTYASMDFDINTRNLLYSIVSSSITLAMMSGLVISPSNYDSIEKLKELSNYTGILTIKQRHDYC